METEEHFGPLHRSPRMAKISLILGILSVLSASFALFIYIAILPHVLGYLPRVLGVLSLLFWLPWMLIPTSAIICGYQARKRAIEQTLSHLALAGLLLGSVALVLIGTGLCATLTLLIQFLTRPPGIIS